jgi:hypothetical protein
MLMDHAKAGVLRRAEADRPDLAGIGREVPVEHPIKVDFPAPFSPMIP